VDLHIGEELQADLGTNPGGVSHGDGDEGEGHEVWWRKELKGYYPPVSSGFSRFMRFNHFSGF